MKNATEVENVMITDVHYFFKKEDSMAIDIHGDL